MCYIFLYNLLFIGLFNMSTLNQYNFIKTTNVNVNLVEKLAFKVYNQNKILADLTTAQAILESNLTDKKPSELAFKYNNLFGVKGKGSKGSIKLLTKEYIKGKTETLPEAFAWNASVEDSIKQRKELFEKGTKDYPTNYFKVLSAQTFEEAAKALTTAKEPYASDPNYSERLIHIYHKYIK